MTSNDMPRCEALNRQGNSLLEIARIKHGKEADEFFKAAGAAYTEALQLNPDMAETRVGLGCARLALASRTLDAAKRDGLLRQARETLLAAERLDAKAAAYNLACAEALAGDVAQCRFWLERCKATLHLPPVEQLRADPDLASVRGEPWFGGAACLMDCSAPRGAARAAN